MNKNKVSRDKAFLGAIIGAGASLLGSAVNGIISARKQKKALKRQQAQQTEQAGYQTASAMTSAYANQDYVDEYNKKITLKNGGKIDMNSYSDRIKTAKKFACGGKRRKASLGVGIDVADTYNDRINAYKCGGRTKAKCGIKK